MRGSLKIFAVMAFRENRSLGNWIFFAAVVWTTGNPRLFAGMLCGQMHLWIPRGRLLPWYVGRWGKVGGEVFPVVVCGLMGHLET